MTKVYLHNIKDGVNETICKEYFPVRFEKSKRFRFEDDRLRSLAAAELLFCVLGLTEKDICFGKYGKPLSEKINKKFNISHSGDYCALAVSENEVGMDIEKQEAKHLSVAERILMPDETEYMLQDEINRFFALWTMKESFSKLSGKGLQMSFESFGVLPLIKGESIASEGKTVYGESLSFDGYTLSVCEENEKPKIELIKK